MVGFRKILTFFKATKIPNHHFPTNQTKKIGLSDGLAPYRELSIKSFYRCIVK